MGDGSAHSQPHTGVSSSKDEVLGKLDGSRDVGRELEELGSCFLTECTLKRLLFTVNTADNSLLFPFKEFQIGKINYFPAQRTLGTTLITPHVLICHRV